MNLETKYKGYIAKIITEIKLDICKLITDDVSPYNDILDKMLEYSDQDDINAEYDIYYHEFPYNPYQDGNIYRDGYRGEPVRLQLDAESGDFVMTEDNLLHYIRSKSSETLGNLMGLGEYSKLINKIEQCRKKEIHIWIGYQSDRDWYYTGSTQSPKFEKLKECAESLVKFIEGMYPNTKPKIDTEHSPSLAGQGNELVIILVI